MRPIKLTMSAFGPYANEQSIDFTKLGTAGLYLISGETGSGKTTIFDAISFALYGKASAAARDDYTALRSDFAPKKTKTFVKLDFVSGESAYSVRRAILKNGQDATLLLPDGQTASGDRSIRAKITEIIGLDRDQFSQIVMIAQNDFLRFLHSGTEERLKILRRIFGTEALRHFQEELKTLAKQESDHRTLLLHDFERHGVDVYTRDESFAQWEAQCKADRAELSEIDKQLAKHDKRKQELAAALAVAEELDKRFTALSLYRAEFAAHNAKSNEMADAAIRAERAEASLYKVKPLYDEAEKAAESLAAAQAALQSAQTQKSAADCERSEAVNAIEALPPLSKSQEACAALVKAWETAAQDRKNLLALQANRNEMTQKQRSLVEINEELTTVQASLRKLPPIGDLQAELDKAENEQKQSQERLARLTAFHNDFAVLRDTYDELAREQAAFAVCSDRFTRADEQHRVWEEAFLRNQAGVLAAALTNGEPCPVCGSVEHPHPAKLSDGDIDEAMLIKAKELRDEAGTRRETKASECAALQSKAEILAKRLCGDASPLIPGITIENTEERLQESIAIAQTALQAAAEQKTRAEQTLAETNDSHESLSSRRDALTTRIASLQGETNTLTKRFMSDLCVYAPNVSPESSESALAGLLLRTWQTADKLNRQKEAEKKSLDLLASQWEAAEQRKAEAEAAAQSAQTLVNERSANEQALRDHRDETRARYEKVLRHNAFSDTSAFRSALLSEDELAALKKQLADYEKSGERLARDIARLEDETAGRKQADIACLQNEADAINAEAQTLHEKRDELGGRLQKTDTALKELRRSAAKFRKSEETYAAVKQLADTANGKLGFETYAQTAYFERVLRAANLRLRVMSQSRYALLRKTTSGDARKRSGLDIEVMDSYTGKARSAASLSGGESFMASLSLALGLSDVVRQNAGGIRLDAMFIDEGFGSLDAEVLELAVRTLSEMAGASRIIGIISHVAELRERIEKQLHVEKTACGSNIKLMV